MNKMMNRKEVLRKEKEWAKNIAEAWDKRRILLWGPVAEAAAQAVVKQNNTPKKFSDSGYEFSARLTKHGFKKLGSGMYSSVFHKSGDRVIKVIRTKDQWIEYVKWASKEGQAGKLAPKVYSYKDYGTFAVAIMEKLPYTARQTPEDHPNKIAYDLVNLARIYPDNYNAKTMAEMLAPGAVDFANKIEKQFKSTDFHGGNFMLRDDGSLVFTDPVCGYATTTHKRLRTNDLAA